MLDLAVILVLLIWYHYIYSMLPPEVQVYNKFFTGFGMWGRREGGGGLVEGKTQMQVLSTFDDTEDINFSIC